MDLKKYRFVLLPGIVIAFTALSVLFVLPGHVSQVRKDLREIKEKQEEIEDLKTRYLLISSLDLETLTKQASIALAVLPETKNVPYVLQGLRNAVLEAKFAIKEMKFSPGEIKKGDQTETLGSKKVGRLPIEIETVGSFENVTELFSRLEKAAPVFEILNMELTSSEKKEGSCTLAINLSTFYSPPLTNYKSEAITLESLVLNETESSFLETLTEFTIPEVRVRKSVIGDQERRENPFAL